MTLQSVLLGIGVVYGGSEVILAVAARSRAGTARRADRGSLVLLWTTIALSIFAAVLFKNRDLGRFPGPSRTWVDIGVAVLAAGLALRWTAILTLRRAFTVDVAVAKDQRLIVHGLYGVLRHPSYSGNLVAFLGMALVLSDWVAGLALLVPITAAFFYRIQVEERVLREAFGEEYERYARRTWRLIPFVY